MSSEKNKSLGHNSFNIDDYKNGMEQIKNATAKLSEVWRLIRKASNYHIGSHGGDYYFADEPSTITDIRNGIEGFFYKVLAFFKALLNIA